ncbi:MAG TPA: hemerythrin domain-containing protein [Planctomycetes bacterium]|nr:hemerythrin domain-containing protein [Planctomycetota bacterium]
MQSVLDYFTTDHRGCDSLWAKAEGALEKNDGGAKAAFEAFDAAMRRHFAMEEELLFPAIEERTGMVDQGPTAVMRMEHEQMRGVLDQMAQALEKGDHQAALDQGDTLLMLIQQHNIKEEGVLYPMADQVLGEGWEALAGQLKHFEG